MKKKNIKDFLNLINQFGMNDQIDIGSLAGQMESSDPNLIKNNILIPVYSKHLDTLPLRRQQLAQLQQIQKTQKEQLQTNIDATDAKRQIQETMYINCCQKILSSHVSWLECIQSIVDCLKGEAAEPSLKTMIQFVKLQEERRKYSQQEETFKTMLNTVFSGPEYDDISKQIDPIDLLTRSD